jgi:Icc protein
MNTHETFSKVLGVLQNNEEVIDLVLATGDIAQDGSAAAYQKFMNDIQVLDAPVRWIPGNHDIRDIMRDVAGDSGFCNKVEKIGNWQVVLLDSSRLNHVDGFLNEKEMEFLESALTDAELDNDIDHCLITLHHNPVPGSSSWMKDIGLRNDREFLDLIKNHDIVRSVVYGHIHQDLDFMMGDVRYFCTPSTCIQFKPEVIDFALDEQNPGYRRFELFADGRIDSEVVRINGSAIVADFDSEGY